MAKTFKKIGNSNILVAHNGQNVWNATVATATNEAHRKCVVISGKAPVTWQDLVQRGSVPVFFKDTELSRRNMKEFLERSTKLVVISISGPVSADGKRSYKEAARVAEVVFDASIDTIEWQDDRRRDEYVVWCRIARYIA